MKLRRTGVKGSSTFDSYAGQAWCSPRPNQGCDFRPQTRYNVIHWPTRYLTACRRAFCQLNNNFPQRRKKHALEDCLKFKKMLAPIIHPVLFWIGVAISVISGIVCIVKGLDGSYGGSMVLTGIMLILFGPVIIRIYCELLITIFPINDKLTDVKNLLKDKTTINLVKWKFPK